MYRDLSVAVVIPAFNEERSITGALESVPDFVDEVMVVDDASEDGTGRAVGTCRRPAEILRHPVNLGVGAAIVTGYRRAAARGLDVVAVMAGDGQMDPDDLPALLQPLADGVADYAKGNRFLHPDVWRAMPPVRLIGNVVLSMMTRVSSGYRAIFDSQCGYTAITRRALERIDLDSVFPRYGYPNDLLARLHAAGLEVIDVPVRPVYGPAWRSGIRPAAVAYPLARLLYRSWRERLLAERSAAARRCASA